MARIRTIKPEFWSDEKLSALKPVDRLVFLGLISLADDYGRVHDVEKVIDAFIFPNTDDNVRESLATLSRMARIRRGKASSGKPILEIMNWAKHQRVDKPQPKMALPPIVGPANENVDDSEILEPFANDSGMVRHFGAPRPTTTDLRPPTNKAVSTKRPHVYSLEFERFWKAFPSKRREKKFNASGAWGKALNQVGRPDAAEFLISRADEYANSPAGQGEFVKGPEPWLNCGCWDDAPEAWGIDTEPRGVPRKRLSDQLRDTL